MTTPGTPAPDSKDDRPEAGSDRAPGVEIGMSEDDGSTFEPEEDAEAD
ncbi:MAG TPA: hypothetical protein VIH01_12510 [Blastococcus sp.]|jgi:hypothetical protein